MNSPLPLLALLLCAAWALPATAQNTERASDLPCSIETLRRDPADQARVLITMQGRSHWKYSGPLASGDVSIMLGEGYVYRFVRQGERISTENLGRDLPLRDGEPVLLDQGAVSCRITPQLQGAEPAVLIDFEMAYTQPPQRRSFRLPVRP